MALVFNHAAIPSAGGVVINNTTVKSLRLNNTEYWKKAPEPVYIYNEGAGYISSYYDGGCYENRQITWDNLYCWYIVPWTDATATWRSGGICSGSPVDVTEYTTLHCMWTSHSGYGDAWASNPTFQMFTSVNGTNPQHSDFLFTDHEVYPAWHEGAYDISWVTGNRYIHVRNTSGNGGSYNGASGVRIRRIWLT